LEIPAIACVLQRGWSIDIQAPGYDGWLTRGLRLDERHVARLYHASAVEIAPRPFNRSLDGAGAVPFC